MHKPLRAYAAGNPGCVVAALRDDTWKAIVEIESVMRISCTAATLDQIEQHFVGALGYPLHTRMLESFRADTLWVIDLPLVSASPIVGRVETPVDEFSDVAKECLRRATLEAERRYCGNRTEVLNNADVILDDPSGMAMLLDPRTCHLRSVWPSNIVRREKLEKLRDLYLKYATRAAEYHEDIRRRAAAAAAAAEPEPAPEPEPAEEEREPEEEKEEDA